MWDVLFSGVAMGDGGNLLPFITPAINPLTPERVRTLVEIAFWDGMYRGAVLGLLAGVFFGIVISKLLGSNGSGNNPPASPAG